MTTAGEPDVARRLPALDGVRAGGALLVWTAHGLAYPGGALAVPIFFVLSGYLITRLLVDEHDATGTLRLPAFSVRRLRRLVPALVAAVVLALVVTPDAVATPEQSRRAALHALTWTTNLADDVQGPLVVAWSLSAEEQFYLVWPGLLLLLLRLGRRTAAVRACAVGLVLSGAGLPAVRLLGGGVPPRLAGTTVALLTGCGLALVARRAPVPPVLGPVALTVIVTLVVTTDGAYDPVLASGGYTVLALAVAALLAVLVDHPSSRLAVAFSVPSLVWFGQRSYGFYVYHLTIAVTVAPLPGPRPVLIFSGLLLSTGLAHLSYEHWERRWTTPRTKGSGPPRRGAGRGAVGGPVEAAVVASVGPTAAPGP